MNRKASLSLSINAIVVIVIAFVVLGLGLSLTRAIFKAGEGRLPEAIALTDLESRPTSENPITVPGTVDIKRSGQKTMKIGYYNRGQNTALGASLIINRCQDNIGEDILPDKLPKIASTAEDVGPSDSTGYSIIMNEQGLNAGTYICSMVVCDVNACETTTYEKKQFFLQVTA